MSTRNDASDGAQDRPVRKRKPRGSYQSGVEVRLRILTTALKLFGQRGYDGVSMRELAKAAGVHSPVIHYYFDSKEALYRACSTHQTALAQGDLEPLQKAFEEELAAHGRFDDPYRVLDTLISVKIMSHQYATDEVDVRQFFTRDRITGGAAFDDYFTTVIAPGVELCVKAVAQILGRPADEPEVRIIALSVIGQVSYFFDDPAVALRTLGWESFGPKQLSQLDKALQSQRRVLLAQLACRLEPTGKRDQGAGSEQ